MYIDIINIFRFQFRIFQCVQHNQFSAQSFRMRSCQVISVGRSAYTGKFRINLGTTCFCMFQFFQNQTACAFTHHKAITACTKRAGCTFRIIITGRQSMHSVKTAQTSFKNSSFRTTCHNYICFTQTDIVKCIGNSI